MPSDNLVLIDTSVWIDYLSNKGSPFEETVDRLLEGGQVACSALILAELVQGARSEREISQLKEFFRPVHWIAGADRHWEQAGELSYRLKRSGKTVGLTDCYLAALANEAGARILTADKDFQRVADAKGCELFVSQ